APPGRTAGRARRHLRGARGEPRARPPRALARHLRGGCGARRGVARGDARQRPGVVRRRLREAEVTVSERLTGVFTALVTPFDASGAFAEAAHRRLVARQIEGGA